MSERLSLVKDVIIQLVVTLAGVLLTVWLFVVMLDIFWDVQLDRFDTTILAAIGTMTGLTIIVKRAWERHR